MTPNSQKSLDETLERLIEICPALAARSTMASAILKTFQAETAATTRADTLLGLKSNSDLMEIWGVNRQRVNAHINALNKRWGVGRRVGNAWLLTAEESERYRPGPVGRQ